MLQMVHTVNTTPPVAQKFPLWSCFELGLWGASDVNLDLQVVACHQRIAFASAGLVDLAPLPPHTVALPPRLLVIMRATPPFFVLKGIRRASRP